MNVPSKIAAAADRAINIATRDKTYVHGTNEPSLVARLVAALPVQLVKRWGIHFGPGVVQVTSAFCHPRPQAHWDSNPLGPGRSELCDLLLLVASPDKSGVMTERALLIQAKNGINGIAFLTSAGDIKQRYMYANWPDFHIAKGNCNKREKGKGAPKSASKCVNNVTSYNIAAAAKSAARYGIVQENARPAWRIEALQASCPSSNLKTRVSIAKSFDDLDEVPVSATLSLGQALEDMVNHSLGYPIQYTGTDDWTEVIATLTTSALNLHDAAKFHLVTHAPGVSVVPISSAMTFATVDLHRVPIEQSTLIKRLHPHWHKMSGGRGVGFTAPREQIEMPINDGFGIIRIALAGYFKDEKHSERKPKTRPIG